LYISSVLWLHSFAFFNEIITYKKKIYLAIIFLHKIYLSFPSRIASVVMFVLFVQSGVKI
jgi:hypothetical protein